MSLSPTQLKAFLDRVIVPVLEYLARVKPAIDSTAARQVVLATSVFESGPLFPALVQEGGGPALSPFQMEPATHDDNWDWLRSRQPELAAKIRGIGWSTSGGPSAGEMVWNLHYAVAMCRAHYWRVPAALPPEGDAWAMAAYHKEHYNRGGKADAAYNAPLFTSHVAPLFTE